MARDSVMRLVVTGASGKLGRRTAELTLERCTPNQLILVTRTPAALDDFVGARRERALRRLFGPGKFARGVRGR